MTDCGDHWNHRSANSARHQLFVESPEIFDRAAAATDDDYIDPAFLTDARVMFVEEPDGPGNFAGRAVALDAGRSNQQMNAASSPRDYVDNVAKRRAARRGDHADPSGKDRNRALQLRREQSFCLQSRFGLFKCQLQRARAHRFQRLNY